jgi:SAM-dependent methyltransferase
MDSRNNLPILQQLRDYDSCFGEFLERSGNGQKIMQAILLREAFSRFAEQRVGIRQDRPTAILDVSCGPGDYSVAWTTEIAHFLPRGMVFYCTNFPGGVSHDTGQTYAATTAAKIAAAGKAGRLTLARTPVGIDANLFAGEDRLMPAGEMADIVHWSHSGYHARDALGVQRDEPRAVAAAINIAIDKIWAALDPNGLMFSVHQTRDISDGVPSQMLPISRKYCGALGDVPQRIEARIRQLGGYATAVNFASPLKFPPLSEVAWQALKQPEQWDRASPGQARVLRLLNFIAYNFSDPGKASLETLAETNQLAAYVDEFKSIVAANGGHIIVKCAFQMLSKSGEVGAALTAIAAELKEKMPEFCREMTVGMER